MATASRVLLLRLVVAEDGGSGRASRWRWLLRCGVPRPRWRWRPLRLHPRRPRRLARQPRRSRRPIPPSGPPRRRWYRRRRRTPRRTGRPRLIGGRHCVVSASMADFVRMILRNFSTSSRFSPPGVTVGSLQVPDALPPPRPARPPRSARSGRPRAPSRCLTSRVFGAVRASSITVSADSATLDESADFMAIRRILRGRSLWYERGCGPKTTPPPVQCGARDRPGARGRPLLAPHLVRAATDLAARLRVVGALALVGELRDDRLVHDRPVRLHAEHPVVQVELSRRPRP